MMPSKLTARGTPRLTKKQRSNVMKRVWAKRRKAGNAQPKVRKRTPEKARSKAMKKSWQQRRAEGRVPAKKQRVLLTAQERSLVSKQAAARRLAGAPKRLREDRKLLGMPRASVTEVRQAFEAARKRLRLPRRSTLESIRKALRIEHPPRIETTKPGVVAPIEVEVRAAA